MCISVSYGEVFWTGPGNQPLPKEIVDRVVGKVMAIMCYEQDQVMVIMSCLLSTFDAADDLPRVDFLVRPLNK